MDIYLEQNCPSIIEKIEDAAKYWVIGDIIADPFYCLFGYSEKPIERFYEENKSEFDEAVEFIDRWYMDVDESLGWLDIVRLVFVSLACDMEEEICYETVL